MLLGHQHHSKSTKMTSKNIILQAVLVCLTPIVAEIHVRPLDPNPGIYYELQGHMRLLRSNWRLIISLSTYYTYKATPSYFANSSVICGAKLFNDECYALMKVDTEKDRLNMLGEIEQRIREIKNDLHLNERTERTKRSFDVISNSVLNWGTKAVRGLFGTLTNADLQDIFSSVTEAIKKGYKFLFLKDKKNTRVY